MSYLVRDNARQSIRECHRRAKRGLQQGSDHCLVSRQHGDVRIDKMADYKSIINIVFLVISSQVERPIQSREEIYSTVYL
jgi:hypothetical protein